MKYEFYLEKHYLAKVMVEANDEINADHIFLENFKNGAYKNVPYSHTRTLYNMEDGYDWQHIYETGLGFIE